MNANDFPHESNILSIKRHKHSRICQLVKLSSKLLFLQETPKKQTTRRQSNAFEHDFILLSCLCVSMSAQMILRFIFLPNFRSLKILNVVESAVSNSLSGRLKLMNVKKMSICVISKLLHRQC